MASVLNVYIRFTLEHNCQLGCVLWWGRVLKKEGLSVQKRDNAAVHNAHSSSNLL